jgi:hypothetical protein
MKMDLFDSPPLQQPKSTARAEGRSLPFSEDGEKGVLCSLLLSPRDILDLCQIKLRPEAFYTPAHHTGSPSSNYKAVTFSRRGRQGSVWRGEVLGAEESLRQNTDA